MTTKQKRTLGVLLYAAALLASIIIPESNDSTLLFASATFSPLLFQQGQNNMGGYQNWTVFIPLSILESMPEIASSPTTSEGYVTATGRFTFKTGETPVFIYCTEETVKYSAETAGEKDGHSYEQKVEFFHPGNAQQAHGLATRIKNTPGIILIADSDGRQQIIGNQFIPAYISTSFDGGQKRADLRGTKFEGAAASNESAVFLETPMSVDPLTGTVGYPVEDDEDE